jgi:TRAP-type C4-dicarboxylate transport system substrate-binding protein
MRHGPTAVVAALTIAATLTACGTQTSADKTGEHTLVIRLALADVLNPNGQTVAPGVFVSTLEQLSGGSIKVQLVGNFENDSATAETDIITAISKGDLDAGVPSIRAFAAAGMPGFQALEAPFVVTSKAAEDAIVTGQVGKDLLKSLDGTGVVGLGIASGVLRRPFGLVPLLNPADWKGKAFRTFDSAVQQQTITALGGVPVTVGISFDTLVREGTLQGAETDLAQYAENAYGQLLPAVVRNVVLWPRMVVLTLNRKLVERMSAQQRGWLQQAADAAVRASVSDTFDDAIQASRLCAAGVKFYDATAADIAGLKAAVEPVLATISSNPVAGPLLAEVEQTVASHPGVDVPTVPDGCLSR